jgi:membrane protein
LLGAEGASAIEALLKSVSRPSTRIAATAFGIGALLVGATTVFAELQDSLDRIWRAPGRRRGNGFLQLIKSRLLSLGMILGLAFLLMVSLVFSAALAAMAKWWGPFFAAWSGLLQIANSLVSFALVTCMFALIYKIMPRAGIQWRDVWTGAAFTAFLFELGKFLIGFYIGTTGITSGFGAAASLMVLLVWVYYSAQIFFFGAEFTWIYSHNFGSRQGQTPPASR